MGVDITGAIKPAFARDTVLRDPSQGRRDVPAERKRAEQSDSQQQRDLKANLITLEKTYLAFNRRLKFTMNEEIHRVVVKVIDAETDKVIKEIPPQEIQDLVARIQKAIGVLVNEMS
jgi:flagellar protein FlaG